MLDWWARGNVSADISLSHSAYPPAGILQSIAFIFKFGQRARLLPHAHPTWALLVWLQAKQQSSPSLPPQSSSQPHPSLHLASNALARKLAVKLSCRVALTFLAPRLAPWRYMREDQESLDRTLAAGGVCGPPPPLSPTLAHATHLCGPV